jgi:hypothetical protein
MLSYLTPCLEVHALATSMLRTVTLRQTIVDRLKGRGSSVVQRPEALKECAQSIAGKGSHCKLVQALCVQFGVVYLKTNLCLQEKRLV